MADPIVNELTIIATGVIDGVQMVGETVLTMKPVKPDPPDPPDPPEPAELLSVCIDYNGVQGWFHEDQGVDRGYWPGDGYAQARVDTIDPSLPAFVVQFRCDLDGGHLEVVFELGDTTVGVPAFNMGAYIATIYQDEDVLAVVEVPAHYWYSRWRWQSAPREVCVTIAELQEAGLIPCFDLSLAQTRPLSPARVYEPMGLAGLTAYVPSTGERDEIGLVTEAQAEFLRGETPVNSLIAQAEASGTFPWHFRNEDGGGVFDVNTHPSATLYGPNIPWIACPVTLDVAHTPALAYVAYLLTRDVYYLEEMHFASTYDIISSPPQSREMFSIGKAVRAHAWQLRGLARCAWITPESGCAWMLPRTYWKDWLDREREWMLSTFVHPTVAPYTEIPYTVFNCLADADGSPASSTLPFGSYTSPWMEDFEAAVLGHVVQMGHEDWRPILEWKIQHCIARTSGTSGWVPAKPSPYNMVMREADKAPYVQDWAECWSINERMQSDAMAHDDPLTIPAGDSLTYTSYCMSALALAATLGIEGATDCYTWLRGQIIANTTPNSYTDRKWSFACA